MEIEKFFEENIKPLISDKLEEIEEDVDLNELNSYEHHSSFNYYEPDYDDYDEDEMYDVCVEALIREIEEYGVYEVFVSRLSEEAIESFEYITKKEEEALNDMTINYLKGKE